MSLKNTILIADDSLSIRVYLKQRLHEAGYEIILASDGKEAIECLEKKTPDLAILDIQMPHVDGYGVCEAMKAMGMAVPVIFLTSEDNNAVQMLGEKLGAYLHKPVKGDQLVETVREVMSLQPG